MKKIVALAIFALAPAAWAQQHAALSEGGEPCVKVECESGQVANQCPRPVNFARCHAADLGGCLLTETVRIESGETLPFACASGKIARVGGCFPPFIPVSVSGSEHICAPDPKDPDALAAANAQAPQAAPKPAPAAQAPAPAPKLECEMDSLLQAAIANNIAAIRCLIESGADVNVKDKYGQTPLHWAAVRKDATDVAALLIENGADVNAKNYNGWTPMDLAIHWGRAEMQSLLSQHGGKAARFAQASPKPAQEDNTASARVAQTPQTPEPEAPLAALRDAPPPSGTSTENTLRKCSQWSGQLSANSRLNTEGNETEILAGAKCEWFNKGTHLHIAARANDLNSVRWLIANSAEINAKDGYGLTPLHRASYKNSAEAAELLLKNGADVNAKNNHGWTPMDLAIHWGHAEMQSLLSRHGGKAALFAQAPQAAPKPAPAAKAPAPAPKSECEMDSLHQAAEENNTAAARCLIKNGANVNAKGIAAWTPLHLAANNNADETAALLLRNGAEIDATDDNGWTPLHVAAFPNATKSAELLLKNGAAVNVKDNVGRTPLDAAIKTGRAEMQSLLKRHGGRCNTEC